MSRTHEDAIRRQAAIREPEHPSRRYESQGGQAGPSGAIAFIAGKITSVHYEDERIHIAALKEGLDPKDAGVWEDVGQTPGDDNSNFELPVCCWSGGLTPAAIDWPAIAFPVPFPPGYMAMLVPNYIGSDYTRFAEPSGSLSPSLPITAPTLPTPPICDQTWCCCKPDGTTELLNEQDCLALGGVFYLGVGDPPCSDPQSLTPPCAALGACCLPDGTCQNHTETHCTDAVVDGGLGGLCWVDGGDCTALGSPCVCP